MKKIASFILIFTFHCISQNKSIDSITSVANNFAALYKTAKTDSDKGKLLLSYTNNLSVVDRIHTTQILQLLNFCKKQNDPVGVDYMNVALSNILVNKGDCAAALHLLFPIASRFEERKDNFGMVQTYKAISNAYFISKDYVNAGEYSKKIIPLTSTSDRKATLSRLYNGIACIYGEGGMPDSGLIYAQKAVRIDTDTKNFQQLALSISTLGENYIAAKEYDIALPYLRRSANFYKAKKATQKNYLNAYLKNDFAQVFLATKQYDSANYYAHRALKIAIPYGYQDQIMRSYEYLYKSFEKTSYQDSVNSYFRMAMKIKDSIFNLEKIKNIQALSFREELRQQEIASEKIKAEEDRRENIQLAFIALAIVTIVILFLLLSRSFITNVKVIEYFGVIALLIVFEFFNLLIHPFLERITHHSVVLMLLALVCLGALLVPLHHKMEHWATKKLVEKNKQVRLAKAKKTIEQLEENA